HAFLNEMMDRRSGHLFYMCSVASIHAYPRGVAYGAAKHGLLGLARAVREETREHGVRVTAVLPGATYTRSWAGSGLPEERIMPALATASLELHSRLLPGPPPRVACPHSLGVLLHEVGRLMTNPAWDPHAELDPLQTLPTAGDLDIHIRPQATPPIAVDQRDI